MHVAHASACGINRNLEINQPTLWSYFKEIANYIGEDVGMASINFRLVELLWLYDHHPYFLTFCRPAIPTSLNIWRMFLLSLVDILILWSTLMSTWVNEKLKNASSKELMVFMKNLNSSSVSLILNPAELFIKRQLHIYLDLLHLVNQTKVNAQQADQKKYHDQHGRNRQFKVG